jgi:hypothetical protein
MTGCYPPVVDILAIYFLPDSEPADHAEEDAEVPPEDQMDEDPKPPRDPNDLSEYKLDEYDEDTGGIGKTNSENDPSHC